MVQHMIKINIEPKLIELQKHENFISFYETMFEFRKILKKTNLFSRTFDVTTSFLIEKLFRSKIKFSF